MVRGCSQRERLAHGTNNIEKKRWNAGITCTAPGAEETKRNHGTPVAIHSEHVGNRPIGYPLPQDAMRHDLEVRDFSIVINR